MTLRSILDSAFDKVEGFIVGHIQEEYSKRLKDLLNNVENRNVLIWRSAKAPIDITLEMLAMTDRRFANDLWELTFRRVFSAVKAQALSEIILSIVEMAIKESRRVNEYGSEMSKQEIQDVAVEGVNGKTP